MEQRSYTYPNSKKNSKKKTRLDDQNKSLMLLRGPVAYLSPEAELLEYECELLDCHKKILEELCQLGRISIASAALGTLSINSRKCHVAKAGQEMVLCDGCLGGCPYKLTREQLNLLTDNFSDKNFLDFTQFGRVYRGTTQQGVEVSVKIWTSEDRIYSIYMGEGARRQKQELLFLKQPEVRNEPHLVKSIGYCNDGDMVAVVYDLKPLDTLHNFIKRDTFTWHQRMNVARKFASLLEFLHSHKPPYLVRNIDAAHIMLDRDSNPVLFDFGMLHGGNLSDELSPTHGYTEKCLSGCYGYIDGLCGGAWTEKADVFAFGVILLMLISKRVCDRNDALNCRFHGIPMPLVDDWARSEYKKLKSSRVERTLVDESLKGDPSFYARDGKKVSKLGMHCTDCSNPEKRPTMAEVVVSLQSLQQNCSPQPMAYVFSHKELQSFTKFNDTRIVGYGTHGTVYGGKIPKKLAKFLGLDSRDVAVKAMKGAGVPDYFENYLAEARWLSRLKHPNIVQLVGHCIYRMTEWFLVYKFVDGWTLDHLINGRSPDFTGQRLLRVIKGIAQGMAYLHSIEDGRNRGLVHGGLKPTNIMVNKDFEAFIIGFGSARGSSEEPIDGSGHFFQAEDKERVENADPLQDAYAFGMTILRTIAWGYPSHMGDELHQLAASAVVAKPQERKRKGTGVVSPLHHVMHPQFLEGDDGCSEAAARTLTEIGVDCTKDWDSRASIASILTRIVDLV